MVLRNSIRGVRTSVNGDAFTGSIEAGYPILLAPWLSFEPQIQGIWQRVWLDQTLVPLSTISFDRADVFTGRAGALLRGTFGSTGRVWQPYLKGNVWWGSNGFDTVTFNGFGVPTGRNGGTTLEGGGGVTGKLTRYVSVYGDASYLTAVSGEIAQCHQGQRRPARDVVRLAADPNVPARSDANVAWPPDLPHVCSTVAFGGKADSRLRALPESDDVVSRGPVDDAGDVARNRVHDHRVLSLITVAVVDVADAPVLVIADPVHRVA